ncbi:unnamed protein product, partial [Prorocentrum cordatum]
MRLKHKLRSSRSFRATLVIVSDAMAPTTAVETGAALVTYFDALFFDGTPSEEAAKCVAAIARCRATLWGGLTLNCLEKDGLKINTAHLPAACVTVDSPGSGTKRKADGTNDAAAASFAKLEKRLQQLEAENAKLRGSPDSGGGDAAVESNASEELRDEIDGLSKHVQWLGSVRSPWAELPLKAAREQLEGARRKLYENKPLPAKLTALSRRAEQARVRYQKAEQDKAAADQKLLKAQEEAKAAALVVLERQKVCLQLEEEVRALASSQPADEPGQHQAMDLTGPEIKLEEAKLLSALGAVEGVADASKLAPKLAEVLKSCATELLEEPPDKQARGAASGGQPAEPPPAAWDIDAIEVQLLRKDVGSLADEGGEVEDNRLRPVTYGGLLFPDYSCLDLCEYLNGEEPVPVHDLELLGRSSTYTALSKLQVAGDKQPIQSFGVSTEFTVVCYNSNSWATAQSFMARVLRPRARSSRARRGGASRSKGADAAGRSGEDIYYTQDSVADHFKDRRTLAITRDELESGQKTVHDIPTITVDGVKCGGISGGGGCTAHSSQRVGQDLSHTIDSRPQAKLAFIDLAASTGAESQADNAVAHDLGALRESLEQMQEGQAPTFEKATLTRLLRPWLWPGSEARKSHVALVSPVRYSAQTHGDVHEWLMFTQLAQKALGGLATEAPAAASARLQQTPPSRPQAASMGSPAAAEWKKPEHPPGGFLAGSPCSSEDQKPLGAAARPGAGAAGRSLSPVPKLPLEKLSAAPAP